MDRVAAISKNIAGYKRKIYQLTLQINAAANFALISQLCTIRKRLNAKLLGAQAAIAKRAPLRVCHIKLTIVPPDCRSIMAKYPKFKTGTHEYFAGTSATANDSIWRMAHPCDFCAQSGVFGTQQGPLPHKGKTRLN